MPRLTPIDPTTATGQAKELLDRVEAALGMTPNMARTMARNPAVLKGWIELNSALGTTLTHELNERLSIAIAEEKTAATACPHTRRSEAWSASTRTSSRSVAPVSPPM